MSAAFAAALAVASAAVSGLAAAQDPAAKVSREPVAASWFEDRTAAAGVSRPHLTREFKNPYAKVMQGYTALGAAAAVSAIVASVAFRDGVTADLARYLTPAGYAGVVCKVAGA